MSENEMLNKKETLEEALGEEIEAVKGTVEEAAENAADKTLEDLEAENEKLRQELELMKERLSKNASTIMCMCPCGRWIFLLA